MRNWGRRQRKTSRNFESSTVVLRKICSGINADWVSERASHSSKPLANVRLTVVIIGSRAVHESDGSTMLRVVITKVSISCTSVLMSKFGMLAARLAALVADSGQESAWLVWVCLFLWQNVLWMA